MPAVRRPPRPSPRYARSPYVTLPAALLCASVLNAPAQAASDGNIAATSSATVAISVSVRPSAVLEHISAALDTNGRSGTFLVSAACSRDAAQQSPLGFDAMVTLNAPRSPASGGERSALASAQSSKLQLTGNCLYAGTLAQPAIGAAPPALIDAGLTLIIAPR